MLQFYTLYRLKAKYKTTFFHYFSPRIPKIWKVWTLNIGRWGQKDEVNKWRKKSVAIKSPRGCYTLYEQKFSNLRQLLSITLPQGFWKFKKFVHWTSRSGVKKMVKHSEKHRFKKKSCSVRQNLPTNNFFFRAMLHPLKVKVFKSETTSFNYFSPKILNL